MLAIDMNVPIPEPTGNRRRTGLVPRLREMPVSGSIFLADEDTTRGRIGSAISYVTSHHECKGYAYTTRKVDGGYRIWRVS